MSVSLHAFRRSTLLLLLFLMTTCALVAHTPGAAAVEPAAITYLPPVNYPIIAAYQVSSSDLDGDGNPDVLAFGGGDALILYGRGDGTFEPVQTVPFASGQPLGWGAVHGVDVTGDGLLDLVACAGGDNRIAVCRNLGNRVLARPVFYAADPLTTDLTAADFNHDGAIDIAASNHDGATMSVLLNRGDGTFHPQVLYPSGGKPGRITSADFNRDGHPDVAITNYITDRVRVFLNDGLGAFTNAGDYNAGSYPASVVSGDFNNDGNPDFATANTFAASVSVFYGNGQGGFSNGVVFPTPIYPHLMSPADLDGDGDLDLAIPAYGPNVLAVLENDGSGGFHLPITFPSGGDYTRAAATGDFNRDGRPDVAIVNQNTANVSIFLNDTTVPPLTAPTTLTATAVSPSAINLAWQDTNISETGFKIEQQQPNGSFTVVAEVAANRTTYQHTELAPDTLYTYRVRAAGRTADSSPSNTASARTLVPTPSAPVGLAATAASSSAIDLAWQDTSTGETGFKIEQQQPDGTFTVVAEVGPNGTSYQHTGLSADTLYGYRVRAARGTVTSDPSNTASARTQTGFPNAPGGLTATAAVTTINLAWNDLSTDETGFKIERREGKGLPVQVALVGANVTTYQDRNLTPGTAYTYRVRAAGTPLDSTPSNEASATVPAIAPNGRLKITPQRLDFGTVRISQVRQRAVRVENVGRATVTVVVTPPQAPFTLTSSVFQLRPGDRRLLTLTFQPGAAGRFSGTMVVESTAGRTPRVQVRTVGRAR